MATTRVDMEKNHLKGDSSKTQGRARQKRADKDSIPQKGDGGRRKRKLEGADDVRRSKQRKSENKVKSNSKSFKEYLIAGRTNMESLADKFIDGYRSYLAISVCSRKWESI